MNRRRFLSQAAATSLGLLTGPGKAASANSGREGKVIVSLGMIPTANYRFVSLNFRMRSGEHREDFSYHRDDTIFSSDRDYDDQSENGIVKILTLASGEWGIVGFSAYAGVTEFSPTEDVFVPFIVRPAETVYIGDYEMMTKWGKNWLGMKMEYDPSFVVADKSQRDVAIAKRKDPSITNVTIAVPSIAATNPYFSSSRPVGSEL